MKIEPPSESNSSTIEDSAEEFFDILEQLSSLPPAMAPDRDVNMEESSLSSVQIEKLLRIADAFENAPPAISNYLNDVMEGRQPNRTIYSEPVMPAEPPNEAQIQRDASFGKWDGESHTWTPHYQLLQFQCEVYLPFLVTEKAVCMKIYESIPEPQRQRIRGYWIKCGRSQCYKWREFLEECDRTYFNKVGAEKAEQKLYSMKQGESQFFREFLEEWELQLEYAGGNDWPQSFKIKQLRRSLSEKLSDKIDCLKLSKNDYPTWVNDVAEVASNIEIRDNFFRRGESRVTQHRNPNVLQTVKPMLETSVSQSSPPQKSVSVDQDGDVVMGGMNIDINALANIVAALTTKNNAKGKNSSWQKTPAPWRTEEEVANLRKRNLCLRCEKPGHISRFCKSFGPPKKPTQIFEIQNLNSLNGDEYEAESGKD